jgi:hypothetical protein
MSSGSLEMFMLLFTKFSVLFNVLTGPPADYASVLETKAALEICELPFKSDALISYLKEGMNEVSEDDIKKSFEQLGSSKAAERKAASKMLVEAGMRAMPYLKKGMASKDPEIKDTSKMLRMLIEKQVSKANTTDFVKKLYAIKALGELKASNAQAVLKIYAASSEISLSEAAKIASAACGGPDYKRRAGVEAIKELQKMIPAGAGFAGVWDFERTSKKDYVNRLIKILSDDMGSGNPLLKFVTSNKAKLLPVIQSGLNYSGNVRIDAVSAFVSSNVGPREGYFGVIVKGKFNNQKLTALMSGMRMETTEYNSVQVLHQYGISMAFIDDETFVWAVGEGEKLSAIIPFIDAVKAKNAVLKDHLKPAFDLVLSGKTRLAVCGRFGQRTIDLISKELAREIDRKRNRNNADAEDILELNALNLIVNWSNSKNTIAWLDETLDIHVKCQSTDEKSAKELAGILENLDTGARGLVSEEIDKNLKRGRDKMIIFAFLPGFDLDKPFGKVEQKGSEVSVVGFVKQALLIIPGLVTL